MTAPTFFSLIDLVLDAAMKSMPAWTRTYRPSLACALLGALFLVLWFAGGASRGDVAGQLVTRISAFTALIVALLFAERRPLDGNRVAAGMLVAIVALPVLQLCPLPPALWQSLSGRAAIAQALPDAAVDGVWRPLSLSPGNTMNAAMSLIVPVTAFVLLCGLRQHERKWLPFLIVLVVLASMIVGLLQFSGVHINQGLINYSTDVRGTFANRNHFALLLALGCLILPYCALAGSAGLKWAKPVAIGLMPLLLLTVLASGSRMGLLLTLIGILAGVLAVREQLARLWRRRSRAILIGAAVAATCIAGVVLVSIKLDRAVSIERIAGADIGQDMRFRAFPTVEAMTYEYAPLGTGLGSFDPIFRIHEPFALLKPTYFNRAHNDFLEVVLDSGYAGLTLIAAALLWWFIASWRVWRLKASSEAYLGRIGSAAIALVALASTVDYPARTPLVMAILAIAVTLLGWGANRQPYHDDT